MGVRDVGGGRPGEVERAVVGHPGKLGFGIAENEEDSPWQPLSVDLGSEVGRDTVTLFPGEGPRTIIDQLSREPESLARSFAATLRGIYHPKAVMAFDCILIVGPEHARVFSQAGWDKAQLAARLHELCAIPADELVRGAGGLAEGLPGPLPPVTVPKF